MAPIIRSRSLACAAVFAAAVSVINDATAQVWEVFDMSTAGLPSDRVNAIAHDITGNTWVGTDWGLCKYDGLNWEIFQTANSDLPENDIRALAVDAQDRLWIGLFTEGLVMKDGNVWTQYTNQNSPLPENQVKCITVDEQGNIWIGTIGGLARFDGTDWRVYDDTPSSFNGLELPGVNIAAVAIRSDSLVAIGTVNAGFTYLTDTSVTVFSTLNGLPDNTGLGVAIDANGERWVASPAGALLRHSGSFLDNTWFQYSTFSSNIPSNALNAVFIDAADRRIVGTQIAGIGIFEGVNTWTNYNTTNSDLPDDEILTLSIDPLGMLWVGTGQGGVARFDYTVGSDEMEPFTPAISIFPNPAADHVTIEIGVNTYLQWTLTDLSGRTLQRSVGSRSFQIDLSGLRAGSYLVRIYDGSGGIIDVRQILKAE